MESRRGRSILFVVLAVLAGTGVACDWTQVLGDPDVAPPAPSSPPPAPDAAAAPDAPAGYDQMCRHYCEALEETDFFACVSSASGRDASTCKAMVPSADSCFDLRCTTRRVDTSLCLAQCDALARTYDAYCPPAGSASDTLCPTSQAEHDRACRAGCAL